MPDKEEAYQAVVTQYLKNEYKLNLLFYAVFYAIVFLLVASTTLTILGATSWTKADWIQASENSGYDTVALIVIIVWKTWSILHTVLLVGTILWIVFCQRIRDRANQVKVNLKEIYPEETKEAATLYHKTGKGVGFWKNTDVAKRIHGGNMLFDLIQGRKAINDEQVDNEK